MFYVGLLCHVCHVCRVVSCCHLLYNLSTPSLSLSLTAHNSSTSSFTTHNTRHFLQALKLFPQHASIHLKYAGFLRHVRKDLPGAATHYRTATEVNPDYADGLGSYASFLHGTQGAGGGTSLAEGLYQRAVEVCVCVCLTCVCVCVCCVCVCVCHVCVWVCVSVMCVSVSCVMCVCVL